MQKVRDHAKKEKWENKWDEETIRITNEIIQRTEQQEREKMSDDTIIINGSTNYIQGVSSTEARINLALGLGDSMYGDSFSFSMTIVSEQIGLQPGDTSGNTGGDTGGDNGDTGDDGGDDYGGDDLPPGGGRPGITGP